MKICAKYTIKYGNSRTVDVNGSDSSFCMLTCLTPTHPEPLTSTTGLRDLQCWNYLSVPEERFIHHKRNNFFPQLVPQNQLGREFVAS
jgi:hypothetical protein